MPPNESKRQCFKCGCSPAEDPNIKLFRFPKPGLSNALRCESWAKYACPDKEYTSRQFQETLYSNHKMLCNKHFSKTSFMDYPVTFFKLHRIAVPEYDSEKIIASSPTITMGDCANITPFKQAESIIFKAVVQSIRTNYPDGWETWGVINYSYEDLFSSEISTQTLNKLRLGLPTVEIVQAFIPNATILTESFYNHIKKVMLKWPLGRALIYSPHELVEKIHAPSFKVFIAALKKLKVQGKLTSRETTSKILAERKEASMPVRRTPSPINSANRETDGMSTSPTVTGCKRRLSSESIEAIPSKRIPTDCAEYYVEDDTNVSFESAPENTIVEDEEAISNLSLLVSKETPQDNEGQSPYINESNNSESCFDTILEVESHTTEAESELAMADPDLILQGEDCQSLGNDGWKNIQYAEVQKQFEASPVFATLKVNKQLVEMTPDCPSIAVLERNDRTLGAITNGLLQLRQIFEMTCETFPRNIRSVVAQQFLGSKAELKKKSDDLLRYVCGRRAEVIKERRNKYDIKGKTLHKIVHSIPPSNTHLFIEPEFSMTVGDIKFNRRYKRTVKKKKLSFNQWER